jgi:hypothetical protein
MKSITIAILILSASSFSYANDPEFEGAVSHAIGNVAYTQEVAIQDEDVVEESTVEVATADSTAIQ